MKLKKEEDDRKKHAEDALDASEKQEREKREEAQKTQSGTLKEDKKGKTQPNDANEEDASEGKRQKGKKDKKDKKLFIDKAISLPTTVTDSSAPAKAKAPKRKLMPKDRTEIANMFRINHEKSISQFLFRAPAVVHGGPGSKGFRYDKTNRKGTEAAALDECLAYALEQCKEYGLEELTPCLKRWAKH